jgi:hypothetical protein
LWWAREARRESEREGRVRVSEKAIEREVKVREVEWAR